MKIIRSLIIVLIFLTSNVFSKSNTCDTLASKILPYANSYMNNSYFPEKDFKTNITLPATCTGLSQQLKSLKLKIIEFNNNGCQFQDYPNLNPSIPGVHNAIASLSDLLSYYSMLTPSSSNKLCEFPSSDTSLPSTPVAKLPTVQPIQPSTEQPQFTQQSTAAAAPLTCHQLSNKMLPYLELLAGFTSQPADFTCRDFKKQNKDLTLIANLFYTNGCKFKEFTNFIAEQHPNLYTSLYDESDGYSIFNSQDPFTLDNFLAAYPAASTSLQNCILPPVPNIFIPSSPVPTPGDISFNNNTENAVIPLIIEDSSANIKVAYEQGDFKTWLIDTGWTVAAISTRLAKLPGKTDSYTDFGTEVNDTEVTIPSLQIGKSVIASKIYGADNVSPSVLGGPGILGAGVFADNVIKFDFPNSKLYIYSPEYFEQNKDAITNGFTQLNAIRQGNNFLVTAKINGQPVPMPDGTGKGLMILDTGSQIVSLANRVANSGVLPNLTSYPVAYPNNQVQMTGGGSSGVLITYNMYNQELELEAKDGGRGIVQESIPVGLPVGSSDTGSGLSGDFGFPALQGLAVIFDYPGGNIWAKKP